MAPEEGWGGGGGGPDCEVRGIRRGSVSCEYAAGNVIQEPVDTEQEVLAGDGTTAPDAPMVAVDGVQFQGLTDGVRGQCSRQVLLVGKDEEGGSSQALGGEKWGGWGVGTQRAAPPPLITQSNLEN